MKIRSVRLREVGCFVDPVKIEGLVDGLNVLAGPNELGKSTIFRALRTLFQERYHSNNAQTKRLRSLREGARVGIPLIEAEFEAGDAVWRLRKQFAASKTSAHATLHDANGGQLVARGPEVEEQLQALIGGVEVGERFGLLWAEQGHFEPIKLRGGQEAALRQAIEQEVESVAVGAQFREVQTKVREALAELESEGKQRKPRGRYKDAIERKEELGDAFAAAREAADRAQQRLKRLADLRESRERLSAPERQAELQHKLAAVRSQLEEARQSRAHRERAELALKEAMLNRKTADGEFARFEEMRATLKKLSSEIGGAEGQLALTREQVAAKNLAFAAAREAQQEAERNETRAREVLRAVEEAERVRLTKDSLEQLRKRLKGGNAAQRAIDEQTALVNKNGATLARLKQIRALYSEVREGATRLAAARPTVSVGYFEGAEGRVRVDGRVLDDGETLNVEKLTKLEVGDVGEITIEPGVQEELVDDRIDLEARQHQLEDFLREIGATDPAHAEILGEERSETENGLAQATARLALFAPNGLAALAQEISDLERLHGSAAVRDDLPERGSAEQAAADAQNARALATNAIEQQGQDLATAKAHAAALVGQLDGLKADLAARRSLLPNDAAVEEKRRVLEADVGRSVGTHEEAMASAEMWRARTPDDSALETLVLREKRLRQQEENGQRELQELEAEMRAIEAQLERDGDDGVGERVGELEGQVTQADEQVCRYQSEIEALRMLGETLGDVQGEARETYLEPVGKRIRPYLEMVFDEANVDFGDGFDVTGLTRGARTEMLGHLSDGTREQIAVLVRLGFARLLAERGQPAPVILDDALVFSDDSRIERLFDALQLAAQSHQVIVLTCRERTFEMLGGNRLHIEPWEVGE